MANTIGSITYGGYTYRTGDTIKVKNNVMYTSIIGTMGNTINMLSQCTMQIAAIWEGSSGGITVKNPLYLKWVSGPSGSYNGGGYIRLNQIVAGSGGTPNNFIVNYEANGGSGSMASVTHTYGVDKKLSKCTFTKTGYHFIGWRARRDYDGEYYGYNADHVSGWYPQDQITEYILYKDEATVAKTAPHGQVYLTAQWQPNNYTATYKANGGSGSDKTQSCVYGQKFTSLDANTFSRIGYTFQHWLLNGSSKDTWGANATAVYGWPNNVSFYAAWKPNTYQIIYKANGGTGADVRQSCVYGQNFTSLAANTFSRKGYTFMHWLLDGKDSWGASVSSPYGWTKNVEFYAAWKVNEYAVSVNPNGGTWKGQSGTAAKLRAYNSVFDLPDPIREGYTFARWTQSGAGTISGTKFTVGAGDVTLTAIWQRIIHTVTFDANGGGVAEASRRVAYGDKVGKLPVATKKFYKHVGWFTAREGGTQIFENHVIIGDVTCYAHYVIDASLHEYKDGKLTPMLVFEYTGGQWKKAFAFERSGGTWKQGIGG